MAPETRYEETLREWARLASEPMAKWKTARMNALVDEMQELQLGLRETAEGRGTIERLAMDSDLQVRGWAAVHATMWNEPFARRVLVDLRDSGGPASFEAKWTLKELDRGKLDVDWRPRSRLS